jgi:hypothetical protein
MTVYRYVPARYAVTGSNARVTWLNDPCPRPASWSWVECDSDREG